MLKNALQNTYKSYTSKINLIMRNFKYDNKVKVETLNRHSDVQMWGKNFEIHKTLILTSCFNFL